MPLPHPHDHLVRRLQASPEPRDQALAALLVDLDSMKTAVFGHPAEPEEGLMTRVSALERFRTNARLTLTVGIPTVLGLLFAAVAAFRHIHDLAVPEPSPATAPPSLPGRSPHD